MFSLGKSASKSPSFYRKGRRSRQRAEQKYRPRLEHLEGRALPSVTRLAIDIPVVETIGNLSVNYSLVLRVDFFNYSMFGGNSGGGAGFYNSGSVTARPAASSQTPAATVISSVTQAAPVAPDALQVAAVPTATSRRVAGVIYERLRRPAVPQRLPRAQPWQAGP